MPVADPVPAGLLDLNLESSFASADPLTAKAVEQVHVLRLQGDMARYAWLMNGQSFDVRNSGTQTPQVKVKSEHRVALKFVNDTGMWHPTHSHGHSFQVIDINGRALNGALSDTVLVNVEDECHRVVGCKQPQVVVRALSRALASGGRNGNIGAL